MHFIDTHTHLFLPEFDEDRNQVVERAIQKGVVKLLLPNVDNQTINPLLQLCKKFPDYCFPMIGLHPTSVKENFKNDLKKLDDLINQEKFVAIGETGIDLYWDKTFFDQQQEAFIYQINLAKKHKIPIVIHARDSFNEIFSIMHQYVDDSLTGVFHAFTGNLEQAKQIIEWGFMIGIGGIVTFKNSGLDKIVEFIDLNHIVLESDSPYLAPVPHRGKRNESSYIITVAEKIAQLKDCPLAEIAEKTTHNASVLFKL
ncbi:MAG: hydrolase TatD [Bacteroidetes bacterium GWF2_33_16]|nr:MAG: hydrolase TatD [Bacteroidetes bacterium GWE2_32_14]OFY03902.1 MAG: hydrolase TatD [Bacteroidetes bacterium GWF2_33_16]